MSDGEIRYFNRYTGQVETERVYGDRFLRWTYGTSLGQVALHTLVKRAAFSRWYGWRMSSAKSRGKIPHFIKSYNVDESEFADKSATYQTFNDFFYRKLKPGARPIHPDKDSAIFPADGRHLGFHNISKIEGIFVKGAVFDLSTFVQNTELAQRYREGAMLLSRLCPVDYHRYHFPVNGVPGAPVHIHGPLFSVNPIALRKNIEIFSENRRAWCEIDSAEFGKVIMFEVGATCVGSFEYTYKPGVPVKKGDEKGFFKFGGSSTVTLFEPGRIQLADDLLQQTASGLELYARMGDYLGKAFPLR